jgi:ABC-type Fe3+/spermidine/putrescine transport system ATPase subunit
LQRGSSEASPTELRVENLVKRYDSYLALDGVSFKADSGKTTAILGPSGSGKTTLLKIISGLLQPDSGRVYFDGADVTELPPQRRKVGYVFQSLALFPHMKVFDNVAFPLDARGYGVNEIESRVKKILELTRLQGLEERYPRELSGGQQQRVALARAIASEAQLLLLDEPLASLDTPLRASLLSEVKRIQEETRITTLYVTHDQGEAFSVGHKLMVIFDGRVEAFGVPFQVFARPPTGRVAAFLGFTNALKAVVVNEGPDHLKVQALGGLIPIPRQSAGVVGKELQILFRPESAELSLMRERPSQLEGVLSNLVFQGRSLRATVTTTQDEIEVTAKPERYDELVTRIGKTVYVDLKVDELLLV